MNKKILISIYIAGLIYLFLIFFLKGILALDPDLGWHIGVGKYILEHGTPQSDPFSYTMPSFPFVDHEWLTNIVIAKFYPLISQAGFSVIFALLTILALIISIPKNLIKWSVIPIILGAGVILPMAGVRPQVETWFFIAILLKILLDLKLWHKYKFTLPLLFILWVNLHGGFAYGIAILAFVLVLKFWEDRKINEAGLLVFIFSILSTFINPYGLRVWGEVWMQFSDGGLRWSISEWMPILMSFDVAFMTLFAFSLAIVLRYRKKFSLPELGLFFGLGAAGISSHRHIALWVVAVIPMVSYAFKYFDEEVSKNKISVKRFTRVYQIFLLLSVIIFLTQSYLILNASISFSEESFYPQKAVQFLKEHPQPAQTFSYYGWGGYLIWKFPEQKVFIDGRMPSWRWDNPPKGESSRAFEDYQKLVYSEKENQEIIAKYNIQTVLWQTPSSAPKPGLFDQAQIFEEQLIGKIFKTKTTKPFLERLKDLGFKEIYKDKVAIIYQKLEPF